MDGRAIVPPVSVGGVGGSGTRLVADVLSQLGYYMGGDVNQATDNLWFTLLFKRAELWPAEEHRDECERAASVFRGAMVGGTVLPEPEKAWIRSLAAIDRPQHDVKWLQQRAESLLQAVETRECRTGPWGWKEPNTHVFLDTLERQFPEMRYIHVVRNGLDVAHSLNQHQLKLWGSAFIGTGDPEVSPRMSLKYWCAVHRRVAVLGSRMGDRFLILNFDRLCAAPVEGFGALTHFLGRDVPRSTTSAVLRLVRPPDSIGRFRKHGLQVFDLEDIAYAESLGFNTDIAT